MILNRNNVKVTGKGTRHMIFAHGFGCDQKMWRFTSPAFENDFRVVLMDYTGSGKSDLSACDFDRYSTLSGYAQDVLDVCSALDIKDAMLVGHSVGGMIGLLASIQEPERFSRLVLIGPSPCYVNDPPDYYGGFERSDLLGLMDLMEKNYAGWASYLAPLIMQNPDRPSLSGELEESFCSTDPDVARRFAIATFFSDNRQDLPSVTVPSLILQCAEDVIAPPAAGAYLHRNLPRSTLRLMEATGHCPHLSHPEETVRLIREYLANPIAIPSAEGVT